MGKTATSKLGKYMRKIGYLDIRQRIVYKKPTEVYVCHTKHVMSGPFKTVQEAEKSALDLISSGSCYDKHKK